MSELELIEQIQTHCLKLQEKLKKNEENLINKILNSSNKSELRINLLDNLNICEIQKKKNSSTKLRYSRSFEEEEQKKNLEKYECKLVWTIQDNVFRSDISWLSDGVLTVINTFITDISKYSI